MYSIDQCPVQCDTGFNCVSQSKKVRFRECQYNLRPVVYDTRIPLIQSNFAINHRAFFYIVKYIEKHIIYFTLYRKIPRIKKVLS